MSMINIQAIFLLHVGETSDSHAPSIIFYYIHIYIKYVDIFLKLIMETNCSN